MSPQFSIVPSSRVEFTVIYEDEHFIALSKPAGVVTQPGVGHDRDTLLNGAFSRWGKRLQNLGKKRDFGLLHRLDRGTSGIVLIALTASSYDALRDAFSRRALSKLYWMILNGPLTPPQGRCELSIAEVRVRGRKRAQVVTHTRQAGTQRRAQRGSQGSRSRPVRPSLGSAPPAQRARTSYQLLDQGEHDAVLVRCQLHTGRLHQIRAHMSALGAPVVGDFEYGGKRPLNLIARNRRRDHLALHAGHLELTHPHTGELITLWAPCPEWFQALAIQLNLELPQELL